MRSKLSSLPQSNHYFTASHLSDLKTNTLKTVPDLDPQSAHPEPLSHLKKTLRSLPLGNPTLTPLRQQQVPVLDYLEGNPQITLEEVYKSSRTCQADRWRAGTPLEPVVSLGVVA